MGLVGACEIPRPTWRKKHTGYMAPDQKRVLACGHYPGGPMAMGWFGFYGGGKGLGLLSLDDSFQTTGLNIARDTLTTMLSAGFVRYPFLKRGTWRSPRSLVRLHRGDWHDDARVYRRWADANWWSQSPRPKWVDQMHGWQRIIMKHQYGEIFYRYSDLVDVFEGGKPYGITALLVFGWFRAATTTAIPDYEPDDDTRRRGGAAQGHRGNPAARRARDALRQRPLDRRGHRLLPQDRQAHLPEDFAGQRVSRGLQVRR